MSVKLTEHQWYKLLLQTSLFEYHPLMMFYAERHNRLVSELKTLVEEGKWICTNLHKTNADHLTGLEPEDSSVDFEKCFYNDSGVDLQIVLRIFIYFNSRTLGAIFNAYRGSVKVSVSFQEFPSIKELEDLAREFYDKMWLEPGYEVQKRLEKANENLPT